MKNVAVLMSTYNGEKYVKEQIISIFNQKYDKKKCEITLYLRDDGSIDNTRKIVQELATKYNIKYDFDGPNLGFAKSFYKLLKDAKADYYFFSDQDDIWTQDKLAMFLFRFKELEDLGENNIGIFSDAWVADEQGRSTGRKLLDSRKFRIYNDKLSFVNQFFEFYAQGASMAINRRVAELLLLLPFSELPFKESHDHFIGLVVSYIGSMSFIDKPTLMYRQSGNNVYGARSNSPKTILNRLGSISSRVKTIQLLLLVAEFVSGVLVSYGDEQILGELQRINSKKNILYAMKFFIKYRKYVSLSNPIIVSVLYGLIFRPNLLIHKKIQNLVDRSVIHENNMGASSKL